MLTINVNVLIVHFHAYDKCMDSRLEVFFKYVKILQSVLQYSGLLWKVFTNWKSKENDRRKVVHILCTEGLVRFDM
jgi:hypothetical protein